MINIYRAPHIDKRGRHFYSTDKEEWFKANDLYDCSRKLIAMGMSGPATAYAANETVSFIGTLEHWAGLRLVERDKSGLRVEPYVERVFK